MITEIILSGISIVLFINNRRKTAKNKQQDKDFAAMVKANSDSRSELIYEHVQAVKQTELEYEDDINDILKANEAKNKEYIIKAQTKELDNKALTDELLKFNKMPWIEGIGYDYTNGIYDHPLKVINPPEGTRRIRIEMREHQPMRIFCLVPDGIRKYHGKVPEGTANILLTHLVERNQRMSGEQNNNLLKVDSVPDEAALKELAKINATIKNLKGELL